MFRFLKNTYAGLQLIVVVLPGKTPVYGKYQSFHRGWLLAFVDMFGVVMVRVDTTQNLIPNPGLLTHKNKYRIRRNYRTVRLRNYGPKKTPQLPNPLDLK